VATLIAEEVLFKQFLICTGLNLAENEWILYFSNEELWWMAPLFLMQHAWVYQS